MLIIKLKFLKPLKQTSNIFCMPFTFFFACALPKSIQYGVLWKYIDEIKFHDSIVWKNFKEFIFKYVPTGQIVLINLMFLYTSLLLYNAYRYTFHTVIVFSVCRLIIDIYAKIIDISIDCYFWYICMSDMRPL